MKNSIADANVHKIFCIWEKSLKKKKRKNEKEKNTKETNFKVIYKHFDAKITRKNRKNYFSLCTQCATCRIIKTRVNINITKNTIKTQKYRFFAKDI